MHLRSRRALPLALAASASLAWAACLPGSENGRTPGEPSFSGAEAMALVATQGTPMVGQVMAQLLYSGG